MARTMTFELGAYVTAAIFQKDGQAAFALGDGAVHWQSGASVQAHDGAILCAGAHPSGDGVVSGGDDGRLVWSRPDTVQELAKIKGRWIESLSVSPLTGLIAFAAAREVRVLDVKDPVFERVFEHERAVSDVALDPKGRRLAAATYGGAALWYARIAQQKPVMLSWAGSHIALAFSPDGKFLLSAMQENSLHGWRLSDDKDMRMGGYPAKPRSLAFVDDGRFLATSGAEGAVLWPFAGANGPMGKQATEVGYDAAAKVTRVAGTETGPILAAGLDDGRVWVCDLRNEKREFVNSEKGGAISALAVGPGGVVAWGGEDGRAGVAELPAL